VRRYRELDADNARWDGFEFRPDDIVIDVPSKSGTTWTQLLVALLVFDGSEFPEPISRMSMWMEQRLRSKAEVHAAFAAQTHRRFIKSHTPLDGVPWRDDVTYVCVGRDPRDAAISMRHHGANMRRDVTRELLRPQLDPGEELPAPRNPLPIEESFDRFIDDDDEENNWSLRFLAHHYTTFWERRDEPNVALFHFADYLRDLSGEISRLADHLGITLVRGRTVELAAEASLDRARARAEDIAPEADMDIWHDPAGFFRTGAVGEGERSMTPAQRSRYADRLAELAPPDLAAWMHDGRG
jgi:hypothetical protein